LKKITFIRHAKSSWDVSNMHDFDRPLSDRGIKDAKLMGKVIMNENIDLDKIISSPANRAINTAKIISSKINYPLNKIDINDEIYNSSTFDVFSIIKKIDSNQFNHIALVGHNPTFHNLIEIISNYNILKLPTCSIVTIFLKLKKYSNIKEGIGIIDKIRFPKNFK
tara:strand:+ start:5061 stop:5558 length:498 start_codon:yes stop_codon:yes gene_type:complete